MKLAAASLAALLSLGASVQAKDVEKSQCKQKYSFQYELLESKCKGETKTSLDKIEALPKGYISLFNNEGGKVFIAKGPKSLPEDWQLLYGRLLLAYKSQNYKRLYGFMFEAPENGQRDYHAVVLRNSTAVPKIALHEFGHALNAALFRKLGGDWVAGVISAEPEFMRICAAHEQKKYKNKNMDCNNQTLSGSWTHNEVWAEQFAHYYHSDRTRWHQKRKYRSMHDYFASLEKRIIYSERQVK